MLTTQQDLLQFLMQLIVLSVVRRFILDVSKCDCKSTLNKREKTGEEMFNGNCEFIEVKYEVSLVFVGGEEDSLLKENIF